MMLKKGYPCYVRLYDGEIVEAYYDEPHINKSHWVTIKNGKKALARPIPTSDTSFGILDCRFVCMTGLNKGKEE